MRLLFRAIVLFTVFMSGCVSMVNESDPSNGHLLQQEQLPTATEEEVSAAYKALLNCLDENIQLLDQGLTDPRVIAKAAYSMCHIESKQARDMGTRGFGENEQERQKYIDSPDKRAKIDELNTALGRVFMHRSSFMNETNNQKETYIPFRYKKKFGVTVGKLYKQALSDGEIKNPILLNEDNSDIKSYQIEVAEPSRLLLFYIVKVYKNTIVGVTGEGPFYNPGAAENHFSHLVGLLGQGKLGNAEFGSLDYTVSDGHYDHIIFSIEMMEENQIIYRVGQGMFITTNIEGGYLLPGTL